MSRAPSRIDEQLAASVRRIDGALEQNRTQYAPMVDEILAATSTIQDRVVAKTTDAFARVAERQQRGDEDRQRRREEWERRREARREHRKLQRERPGSDAGDLAAAIVRMVVAVVCVTIALTQPGLFWMVFVALGFGTSAAASLSRYGQRKRREREAQVERESASGGNPQVEQQPAHVAQTAPQERTAPPAIPPEPADPKVARIQLLCDKLLAELESGPPIVREVVTEPRATIAGLRQACVETARRERELRAVLAAQDDTGLVAERDALKGRLSSEQDPIVRDRLGQALAALEQQLVHRAALATTATRLEAENTRILYTLENVQLQLLRARSTDIGAPELGGQLRDSLRELGTQIDAVAEALEWADVPVGADVPLPADARRAPAQALPQAVTPPRPEATTPAPDAVRPTPDAASTSPAISDAQRAEREAAARRAAQAREAQRRDR